VDPPPVTLIEGYRFTDMRYLDPDFTRRVALGQRIFGPHRLLVLTTRRDRIMVGLTHCVQTDPRELALKCCLSVCDDGAAAAIAFSDECVADEPPPDLRERFNAARAAAGEFGIWLVDWIACDDTNTRSTLLTLQDVIDWPDRAADGTSGCAARRTITGSI
jgi:hypothetical protein